VNTQPVCILEPIPTNLFTNQEKSMNRYQSLVPLALLFCTFLGCQDDSARAQAIDENQRLRVESELDLYILGQNEVLPAMQDPNTRWDSVSREVDHFIYNFSVVNLGGGTFDQRIFAETVAPALVLQTCQDSVRRQIIDNGYTIDFRYHDEAGNDLASVSVSAQECDTP
jgi:hypothetical protein